MDTFQTFFERRMRNPLRKADLKDRGVPNNKEWVDEVSKDLLPDKKQELVNKYLIGKTKEDVNLVGNVRNVKIYADQYVDNLKVSKSNMINSVKVLFRDYRDIIPRRGFGVIITNSKNNPNYSKIAGRSGAYYLRNKIYFDEEHTKNPQMLLHEYAHLLADRAPKYVESIIRKEYEKMINDCFKSMTGKRSRVKKLEDDKHIYSRRALVKRLGIPDPTDTGYGVLNFDEWFAVIIEHWKNLPNNRDTYKFKTIFKKIINRL